MFRSDRSSRTSRPDDARTAARGHFVMFFTGAAGIAILLFAYLAITWQNFAGVTNAIDAFTELFSDFVIYYYPMGEAIFSTELPVEGFLYSPFIAVLLAVFPPLGLSVSLVLWGVLLFIFVIIYLLLFRLLVPAGLKIQLVFVALALSSYPLLLNQLGGQVSVFMIVALLGLLVLYERGHPAAGAGLLAFAASFKFYPIFFIAPFVARRDARFIFLAAAASGTLLVIVPAVLLGPGDMLRFYGALLDAFRDSAWVAANPHSQYFPHIVLRLAGATGGDAQPYLPLLFLITYVVAAANMGLIFLVQRARLHNANLWSFQIVFMTIPFVLKTSWPHDFVFLSFTQALMLWWLLEGKKTDPETEPAGKKSLSSTRFSARSVVTFILLLPSIVLSNIVFFNLFGDFTRYGFYGFLFWANLLLLIAMYVQFLPPTLQRFQQPDS